MKNKLKNYKRNCPSCEKELIYKNEIYLNHAIEKNTNCFSCSKLGIKNPFYNKKHSIETKNIIAEKIKTYLSNPENHGMYGKTHTQEVIQRIKAARAKQVITQEHKDAISKGLTGRKRPKEVCEKIRQANIGKKHSSETLLKLRLWAIKNLEENKFNGARATPNYNKSSILIIEQRAKELGITDLCHAENGGEYFIKELGYWVDGYSKEKNIVIEYYEKHHNKKIERDLRRQKEIIDLLKCEFIIIKE